MAYSLLEQFKTLVREDNQFGASILLTFVDEEKEMIKDIYKKLHILKKKKLIVLSKCALLKPGEYFSDNPERDIFKLIRIEGKITDKGMKKVI